MVNIDNITDAEWRKPSNIAQHKVMRDKINEIIAVVNEGGGGGGGGGSVPPELVADVATLKTDMVTVQALKADKSEVALKADKAEVALKADKAEVALKADKTELALLIAQLFPSVDCITVAQLYNGDTSVKVSSPINAENCTNLTSMFSGCSSLKMVGYIHTPNVTSMRHMFRNCSSLKIIPALDTSQVTDMSNMFYNCSSLMTIPTLDTSKVTDMTSMFMMCVVLTSVTFQCADVRPYGRWMFDSTPIASGNGRIYVPDNLVQAYKTASGWSTHASVIYGHSDKP